MFQAPLNVLLLGLVGCNDGNIFGLRATSKQTLVDLNDEVSFTWVL